MRAFLSLAVVSILSVQSLAGEITSTGQPAVTSEQGVGERVGESIERGLNNIGQKLRKTWADFRRSVDELSVQGRVYGRLHWDKALANAPVEITVQNENVVTLTGSVPNEAAHRTAVTLAEGTVGVGKVVD